MASAHSSPGGDEDPRVLRSREAVLAGATTAFLAHGYDRTSVADIATTAGVARRTVYNVFGDKQALFRAVLVEAIDTARGYSRRLATVSVDEGDPAEVLRRLASDLAESIVGGRVIALRRLLIAEVDRFPELAAEYYDQAPGHVMRALADILARFHEVGTLRVHDPARAGEQLAFLTIGATLDRGLFAAAPARDMDEAVARAEAGVEVFLRAHAVK